MGSGIPINQSNNPRPNPTAVSRLLLCPIENARGAAGFRRNVARFVCCVACQGSRR